VSGLGVAGAADVSGGVGRAVAEASEAISFEVLSDPAGVPRARAMLQRAEWAARAFARYDKRAVDRVVHAAAQAGAAKAREYAEWAVRETGFGVADHKVIKNLACSTGLVEAYATHDYVTPRFDPAAKIVEIPRPAGVVLALTPSTNPVASVFFKALLALMTRSAVVISPHPQAAECCADAARTLAGAAVAAGAPDGVIQVVDRPSVPLIDALMTDERTSVIVATGGSPVVRAAYSSGTPAIGVGPGNVPVLVDATADLARAAKRIVDSKSFDNSILCTNESVLIVEDSVAATLLRHLKREGAYLLEPGEAARVAAMLFPRGRFDVRFVGKDATQIAAEAGLRVPGTTRILLAPFSLAVPEEPLAHEKLCPVLGLVQVPDARRGIDVARAVLRITGRGHSAAIHSTDPRTIMEFGASVDVLRVSVNVGNSLGSSGISTHLAPSMTVGTGYFGRSSLTENLEPKHLVQWTRMAYNAEAEEAFGNFSGLVPWETPAGPVPPYPVASNMADLGGGPGGHPVPGKTPGPGNPQPHAAGAGWAGHEQQAGGPAYGGLDARTLREEIRRVVIEELAQFAGGSRG
jgi:acetaldehyde dehydrogenase/alcohol dehydrogenase